MGVDMGPGFDSHHGVTDAMAILGHDLAALMRSERDLVAARRIRADLHDTARNGQALPGPRIAQAHGDTVGIWTCSSAACVAS